MKRQFYLMALLLSFVTYSFAQVTEEVKSMKTGANNALVIEVADASKKTAERVWKDMMKKHRGKTKKKRKDQQWTTENVRLSSITGQETSSIYAQIDETDNVVEFTLWVPVADDYLSSENNSEAYAAAEKLLEDYALEVRVAVVEEEFKSKARILESYQKDLKKLKKDNEDYHKTIKNSEKAIDNAEKGLIKNDEEQQQAREALNSAEAVFEVANDTLRTMLRLAEEKDEQKSIKKMIKSEEGKVKAVEKSIKKLEREEKKMRKTIEDSKDKIYRAKEDIVKNEKDQERKVEQIAEQQGVVDEVQARLDKLKSYRK